jgi:hypothetical protein
LHTTQGLCDGWVLANCLLGTDADLKTNVQDKFQKFSDDCQARAKAWMCTAADCTNVKPNYCKTQCKVQADLSNGMVLIV